MKRKGLKIHAADQYYFRLYFPSRPVDRQITCYHHAVTIWQEKRSEMDDLQRNLKAVNETHEKVAEKAAEIEDKV